METCDSEANGFGYENDYEDDDYMEMIMMNQQSIFSTEDVTKAKIFQNVIKSIVDQQSS